VVFRPGGANPTVRLTKQIQAKAGVPPQAVDWAQQLTDSLSFPHSRGEGGNIWMAPAGAWSFTQMVDSFGNEKQNFTPGVFPDVSSTTEAGSDVGYYTQMIWRVRPRSVPTARMDTISLR
jgi:hypothetical protein